VGRAARTYDAGDMDTDESEDSVAAAREPGKRPPRRGIYLLPNLLTTACLFSGFYAIVAAIDGNFERSGFAVFAAMLFDGLDGRVARLTSTESSFGKEYDSLADMVAFGLAPAIVSYQWGVERIAEYGTAWFRFGWLAAFFYAATAAMRLARFNARAASQDKHYFEGLPSPSAAAVVAGFVWVSSEWREPGLPGLILAFLVTVTAGILMVSRFGYPSFKGFDLTRPVRFFTLVTIVAALAIIAGHPPRALLLVFGVYAAWAPLVWVWRHLLRRRHPPARRSTGAAPGDPD
jgi:CDP-diacylglycerol--serine O-phosphatidyltransferase